MMKSRILPFIAVAVLLTAFAAGIVALFQLRFNAGDIYPPYSSLRADPLGAKAFCAGLQSIPNLSVDRFYRASSKLGGGKDTALFILGLDSANLWDMPGEDDKALQAFLYSGGRVVVCLFPTGMRENSTEEKTPARAKPKKTRAMRNDTNNVEELDKTISFFDKYGVRENIDRLFIPDADASQARLTKTPAASAADLPESISWHSADYFSDLDAGWRTVYERGKRAVIIERSFGPGTFVLAADSYFVSNEALRKERHPALLAWLAGGSHKILFDETHLGVEENPGVAVLMRRYHLTAFLLGLLLVAALFVWQNISSLIPPYADEPKENRGVLVRGKETSAGFASLLRRNIPPAKILSVCFTEWKNACAREPRAAARLAEVEKIMQAEESGGTRHPVETWQNIQRILTERH
jgi:hypothetical protein